MRQNRVGDVFARLALDGAMGRRAVRRTVSEQTFQLDAKDLGTSIGVLTAAEVALYIIGWLFMRQTRRAAAFVIDEMIIRY